MITEIVGGGTPSKLKEEYFLGNLPLFTVKDLAIKRPKKAVFNITLEALENSSAKKFPADTLIIATRMALGRIARPQIEFAINQDLKALLPQKNIDKDFLEIFLDLEQKKLEALGCGGTVKGIRLEALRTFPVQLPTLAEQKKIADCLSSLDEWIEATSQKAEQLKKYKKGLMQKLFPREGEKVPSLRFPEFQNTPAWEEKKGCALFKSVSNKNHESDLPTLAITQEHGAIPRDQIDYNVVTTDKSIASYKVVEVNDFIISLRSFQGGIEYSAYHGICSPAYVILRLKKKESHAFFKEYFKTSIFIKDLTKDLQGIRDGKMISYAQFSDVNIYLPLLPEQEKIADCLSSLGDLVEAFSQKADQLKNYKKGLMQKLFPLSE